MLFRSFFFKAAFIIPLYSKFEEKIDEIDTNAGNRIYNKLLKQWGIDGLVATTIAKQVCGATKRQPEDKRNEIYWRKFEEVIARGKVTQEKAEEQFRYVIANYSELEAMVRRRDQKKIEDPAANPVEMLKNALKKYNETPVDRKSTRLNSSHT